MFGIDSGFGRGSVLAALRDGECLPPFVLGPANRGLGYPTPAVGIAFRTIHRAPVDFF